MGRVRSGMVLVKRIVIRRESGDDGDDVAIFGEPCKLFSCV